MASTGASGQHVVKKLEPRTAEGDALTAFTLQALRLASLLGLIGDELARPAQQTSARWRVLDAISEHSATVAQISRTLNLS